MRTKAIVGVTAVWLGGAMLFRAVSTTEVALSGDVLGNVFGSSLLVLAGLWMAVRGEALPEDTGEKLVPRRLFWHVVAGLFAAGGAIYTAELLGIVAL